MSFKIIISGVSILFTINLYLIDQAWALGSVDNNCPVFSIKEGCDLSSWIRLIMDALIGAFLAFLFYHLAHKQSVKLKMIIEEHDTMKKRRREFAIQSLKNHLTTLLLSMSLIKRLESSYTSDTDNNDKIKDQINKNSEKISRTLNDIKNILLMLNDVLEPQVINDLNQLCQTVHEDQMKGENRGLTPSNYNYAKNRINDICKTFDELHHRNLPVKELLSSHTSNSYAKLNKSKYMKMLLQKFGNIKPKPSTLSFIPILRDKELLIFNHPPSHVSYHTQFHPG